MRKKHKDRIDNSDLLTDEQVLSKNLMTSKEACRILGISYPSLVRMGIEKVKSPVGARMLFRTEQILEIKSKM